MSFITILDVAHCIPDVVYYNQVVAHYILDAVHYIQRVARYILFYCIPDIIHYIPDVTHSIFRVVHYILYIVDVVPYCNAQHLAVHSSCNVLNSRCSALNQRNFYQTSNWDCVFYLFFVDIHSFVKKCSLGMKVNDLVLWRMVWFYGTSTIVGHLMPNTLYIYIYIYIY